MIALRQCLTFTLLITLFAMTQGHAAELTVFAASSLTEPLREITDSYQTIHPDEQIQLNFAGSQTLAMQIEQGAAADLFISADHHVMSRLHQADYIEQPKRLIQNRLIIAMRPLLGTPPRSLSDFSRRDLLLAIGNQQVPIGRYSHELFANLAADPQFGPLLVQRIEAKIVSQENRVKAIIAKLLIGEVDAGIVYSSDLSADISKHLTSLPLPVQHNPLVTYPMAAIKGANGKTTQFSNFLFSEQAEQIFLKYGFISGGTK